MLGKHKALTLYNKQGNVGKTRQVIGIFNNPSIRQKTWYELNTNKRLAGTINFAGNYDDFKEFDAVRVAGDKSYRIFNMSQNNMGHIKAEVGI